MNKRKLNDFSQWLLWCAELTRSAGIQPGYQYSSPTSYPCVGISHIDRVHCQGADETYLTFIFVYPEDLEQLCEHNRELQMHRIELVESGKKLKLLREYLELAGWGPCNIPACNCNGWHQLRSTQLEKELTAELASLREGKF
jgi:hypothetical protein